MYSSRRRQAFAEMSGARIIVILSVLLLMGALLFLVVAPDREGIKSSRMEPVSSRQVMVTPLSPAVPSICGRVCPLMHLSSWPGIADEGLLL